MSWPIPPDGTRWSSPTSRTPCSTPCRRSAYHSTTYCPKAAPATRLLDDGNVVDLGDRVLEVIHTPGHSPGGIALFERATGILFSGDIVYDGPLIEDCPGADPDAYARSLHRLLELPVRVMHGGHFPNCSGQRLRQLIRLVHHPAASPSALASLQGVASIR